jgi:hypothetical protein
MIVVARGVGRIGAELLADRREHPVVEEPS